MNRRTLLRAGAIGAAGLVLPAHHRPGHEGGPPSDEPDPPPPTPAWRSVWFDGFNGTSLDLSVWEYEHPLFNYGDVGTQHLDSVSLPERVSVHDGAVWLEAVRADWDTRQVSATSTPRIARYQAAQINTRLPVWGPGQRVEFGWATDLPFRPVCWTSAPQAGDDSEMDFEFFSVDDTCHIGQIWDYSPFMQQMYVPSQASMPDPTDLHRYACWRRPDGINIWTIDDEEVFRAPNRMSQNPQRIRLAHCVGGMWDGGYRSNEGSGGSLDPATYAVSQVRWVEITEPA